MVRFSFKDKKIKSLYIAMFTRLKEFIKTLRGFGK